MAQFTETRVARKRHGCEVCRRSIEPGETYERFTATPHDEVWSADRWSRMKAHHPYGSCIQPAHLRTEA